MTADFVLISTALLLFCLQQPLPDQILRRLRYCQGVVLNIAVFAVFVFCLRIFANLFFCTECYSELLLDIKGYELVNDMKTAYVNWEQR